MSRFILFHHEFFFHKPSPSIFFFLQALSFFFLSNPPSRLCMPCFLSNLLWKWLHVSVNWKYSTLSYILFHSSVASLSSHVPFSCVFPRIPHLLFQSLFMLPPNSKKSFVFLVLYVQLICFMCLGYICGTVSEDFSSLHFPVVKQFFLLVELILR